MKQVLIAGFFLLLFILSIRPLRDFDIWFHVKSGEVFVKQGIITHDVFSYTAAGRRWYPYEWLYQVSMYGVQQLFGFEAIKVVTAVFITVLFFFFWKIITRFFRAPPLVAAIVSFFFFVSIHEFFTSRPHIPAYMLFTITLYIILLWVVEGKNKLLFLVPVFLAWANFHGSVFLGILLLPAYAGVSFLLKNRRGLLLLSATPIAFLLTILPPIKTIQYELLWEFYKNLDLIRKFIDEWTPLSTNPYAFVFYTVSTITIVLLYSLILARNKKLQSLWLLLPLLPFPFLAYTASRNIFFGYLTLSLMLTVILTSITKRWVLFAVGTLLVAIHVWILSQKLTPERLYYPVNAVEFIKKENLKGNMFNEYGYGGYLLYHLYPERKVFFDGRTDVYLCCEIQETLDLAVKKTLPDLEYKTLLDGLWNKYAISYVIIRTQKHSLLRKISRILTADPNWSLVFWDDHTQIFIRRDGKNDDVIEKFGASSATPYERNPFRAGEEDRAYEEYARMMEVVDSARSRNAIGFILLKRGELDAAKEQFEKAMSLDPTFESPYMNIAELAYYVDDPTTAINFYKAAVKLAPDRGLAYLRLAQILLETPGNEREVAKLLKNGIANTVDEDARAQLKQLLETIE